MRFHIPSVAYSLLNQYIGLFLYWGEIIQNEANALVQHYTTKLTQSCYGYIESDDKQ